MCLISTSHFFNSLLKRGFNFRISSLLTLFSGLNLSKGTMEIFIFLLFNNSKHIQHLSVISILFISFIWLISIFNKLQFMLPFPFALIEPFLFFFKFYNYEILRYLLPQWNLLHLLLYQLRQRVSSYCLLSDSFLKIIFSWKAN